MNGHPLLGLTVAVAAVALCSSCSDSSGAGTLTANSFASDGQLALAVYPSEIASPALGPCSANRILIQPQGRAVALWTEPLQFPGEDVVPGLGSDQVLIINYDQLRGHMPRTYRINSPGHRLRPLNWAEDGRNVDAVWGRHAIVRLSAREAEATKILDADEGWTTLRLSSTRPGDAAALIEKATARLRQLQMSEPAAMAATLDGDEVRFARAEDLGVPLTLHDGDITVNSGMPAQMLRHHIVVGDAGDIEIFGMGRPGGSAREDIGYRRPVIDLATGRHIGSFGLRTITLDREIAGLSALPNALPRPYLIRDVSVSGNAIAVIFSDLNGEGGVALLREGRREITTFCDFEQKRAAREQINRGGPNPLRGVVEFDPMLPNSEGPIDDPAHRQIKEIDFRSISAGRSEAFATLFDAPGSARDLIVYFHGGPATSQLDGDIANPVRRLGLSEADVMIFEYSGSAARSPELLTALARSGPAAIEWDIAALGRWVGWRGYRQIHLIGASFGAVPMLAALAQPEFDICSASFVVPALAWPETEALARNRRGDVAAFRETRTQFERAIFGGQRGVRRFRSWLARQRRFSDHPGARFYFASGDRLSTPDQLSLSTERRDRVTMLAGSHLSAQQSNELWAAIRRDIMDGCA